MRTPISVDSGSNAMKNITKLTFSALALTCAANAEVDVTAYSGAHSNYIFRGADAIGVNDGEGGTLMDFGLDVSGDCDCGLNWFAGAWYGATQLGRQRDELDLFGGVSKDLGFGTIEAGYITYNFINSDVNGKTNASSNGEVFLGLSTGYAGFDLGLRTFYGVQGQARNNTTIEGTIGYSVEVYNTVIGLEAKAGMFAGPGSPNAINNSGWSNPGSSIDGLAYTSITASTDFALADDITFSPYVSYLQAAEELTQGLDGFVGGATFAYNF